MNKERRTEEEKRGRFRGLGMSERRKGWKDWGKGEEKKVGRTGENGKRERFEGKIEMIGRMGRGEEEKVRRTGQERKRERRLGEMRKSQEEKEEVEKREDNGRKQFAIRKQVPRHAAQLEIFIKLCTNYSIFSFKYLF